MAFEFGQFGYVTTDDVEEDEVYTESEIVEETDDNTSYINEDNDDIDDIVGGPYQRKHAGKYKVDTDSIPKDITFGTEYVAQIFGMSSQAIRNYSTEFEEYLGITKKESGHRRFTQESIDKLRRIIELKDSRGFTVAQVKEYLSNPNPVALKTEEEKYQDMLNAISVKIGEAVSNAMSAYVEQSKLLIEDKDNQSNAIISSLQEQIASQNDLINELRTEIANSQSSQGTLNDALSKKIDDFMESSSEKDKQIAELMRLTDEKDKQIAELMQKSKKKFLGIF